MPLTPKKKNGNAATRNDLLEDMGHHLRALRKVYICSFCYSESKRSPMKGFEIKFVDPFCLICYHPLAMQTTLNLHHACREGLLTVQGRPLVAHAWPGRKLSVSKTRENPSMPTPTPTPQQTDKWTDGPPVLNVCLQPV
jgi:hypothetical protein